MSDNNIKEYGDPSGWEAPAISSEKEMEAIIAHVEKHFGKVNNVFHEIVSDAVHIDVHIINPTPERDYYTLFTTGMSARPMHAPEEYEQYNYGELIMHLPPDWNIQSDDNDDYWPIYWLKFLARFPHKYETWVFFGHTIPNGADAEPVSDNSKFGCMLLSETTLVDDEEFCELEIGDKTIYFMTMFPIYKEEMEYKLETGYGALYGKFSDRNISDIIDIYRPNVCE